MVLVGHGSKAKGFDRAMKRVALRLRGQDCGEVRCAYLEINRPSISEAIEKAARSGAREIRVLPYFVLAGKHVVRDIPKIVSEARRKHGRKIKIKLCPYLGYDERIVGVARDRIVNCSP